MCLVALVFFDEQRLQRNMVFETLTLLAFADRSRRLVWFVVICTPSLSWQPWHTNSYNSAVYVTGMFDEWACFIPYGLGCPSYSPPGAHTGTSIGSLLFVPSSAGNTSSLPLVIATLRKAVRSSVSCVGRMRTHTVLSLRSATIPGRCGTGSCAQRFT